MNLFIENIKSEHWIFSAVYASPIPARREYLWEALYQLTKIHNRPWLVAGDLNA